MSQKKDRKEKVPNLVLSLEEIEKRKGCQSDHLPDNQAGSDTPFIDYN
ncbi:MAG TPA: hypothetical protein VEK32_21830 [Thermodesulfobacteriota bacterium]|nr:hypothetical protein [Thermodesulfobacteriota bacterium]